MQNGHGIETWEDGSKYEGQYKNGMKHGKGKYIWGDKSEYNGDWVNNKINGYVMFYVIQYIGSVYMG